MTSSASQSSRLIVSSGGASVQHQLVLPVGVLQRLGVGVPRAEPPRLDRQPAIRLLLLVSLEDQVAVLPRVEIPQLRKAFLHLLKKVQDRVAVARQLHLGVEVDVDIEIVGVATIAIHPGDPEYLDNRDSTQGSGSQLESVGLNPMAEAQIMS